MEFSAESLRKPPRSVKPLAVDPRSVKSSSQQAIPTTSDAKQLTSREPSVNRVYTPLSASEATVSRLAGIDWWTPDVHAYRKRHMDIGVAESFHDAITKRTSTQQKVLSPREWDICARMANDLNSEMFWHAILSPMGLCLSEGLVGVESIEIDGRNLENPWLIRAEYNRGIKWKIGSMASTTPEKRKKGLDRLDAIISMLSAIGLPHWECEMVDGFHDELLHPEFQNQEDFNSAWILRTTVS